MELVGPCSCSLRSNLSGSCSWRFAVAVAVWIGGAVKTEHGDAANTAGCDRASESRIKVRLRDATPMRSIGMLDLREVLSAFGVEDEVMPQGRRYLRISCEVDIGIEAGFPRRDQCPSCTLTTAWQDQADTPPRIERTFRVCASIAGTQDKTRASSPARCHRASPGVASPANCVCHERT